MKQEILRWTLFLFLAIFMLGCVPVASTGGDSSGSGNAGGGGNTPPPDNSINCTHADSAGNSMWAYEYDGQKPNPNDNNSLWDCHRVSCTMCGYVYTWWCTGAASGCSDCGRAPAGSSNFNPSAVFIPIETYVSTGNIPNLVIVANSSFRNSLPLEKYIKHKRTQGYETVEKYYAKETDAGTIRGHLKTLYDENPNMCVLIVGRGVSSQEYSVSEFVNKNQWQSRAVATDFWYGYYGSSQTDLFPQVPVGRLSAKDESELSAQVEKIIYMEEQVQTVEKNVVLVQQVLNTGDTPFHDEVTDLTNYFNDKKADYTVNEVRTTDLANINKAINDGASLISYTGHGGTTFWGSYNTSYVKQLSNANKYPVVLGVTCNSGNFTDGDECFAEAFMRKSNGGAVGYVGASAAMIAYYSKAATAGNDKVPGMVGSLFWSNKYDEKYKVRTLGGMFWAALRSIKMSNTYVSQQAKDYSIEVLNLFGDPTYMPYTDTPKMINFTDNGGNTINNSQTINKSNSFVVKTNAPYAQVAVTQVDSASPGGIKIIAAKIAGADGNVTLDILSAVAGKAATLYAIAPNHPGKSVTIELQ